MTRKLWESFCEFMAEEKGMTREEILEELQEAGIQNPDKWAKDMEAWINETFIRPLEKEEGDEKIS